MNVYSITARQIVRWLGEAGYTLVTKIVEVAQYTSLLKCEYSFSTIPRQSVDVCARSNGVVGGLKNWRRGKVSCNFPTDSCKFLTEKIWVLENPILHPKHPTPNKKGFGNILKIIQTRTF